MTRHWIFRQNGFIDKKIYISDVKIDDFNIGLCVIIPPVITTSLILFSFNKYLLLSVSLL